MSPYRSTSRFLPVSFCALLLLAFFGKNSQAEIVLSNVKANGSTSANAAHGFVKGNDATSDGDPLHYLLDGRGTADERTINILGFGDVTISTNGMFFDPTWNPPSQVDTRFKDGTFTGFGKTDWTYLGKTDEAVGGVFPFTNDPEGANSGTLRLNGVINGNVVISLKAGNHFAAYAFTDLVNVTSFDFQVADGKELSHATLFVDEESGGQFSPVPEPTSFLMWSVICGLGMFATKRRRQG